MGIPLYAICHFSLVAFYILSLSLIFVSLITECLGVFLLGFILPGTLCASCTWLTISFPILGKFSGSISSSILSQNFSLFSFWDSYIAIVCPLNVSEVSQAIFISFHSCFYILFFGNDFHHSVLQVIYPSFCLSFSAIDSFQCVIHLCLFFSSPGSLVDISCIFSIVFLRS